MSTETELKLRIAPAYLRQLRRHPVLRTLAASRAVTRTLHNVYYDTPGLDLLKRAVALRLRRSGARWLQTMKGGGGVSAGLHSRDEWETPAPGGALDFAALEAAGAPALSAALRKKLRPVFTTDFSRTARRLRFGGAEIELCMDSGEIRAGRKSRRISEIELELQSGEAARLFELALLLLDVVPLEVEQVSKAEHGYRLVVAAASSAVRASPPRLLKAQTVGSALRDMVAACLAHLQANVPGAVASPDEEYLHQVRVALRRLRVVLAMAQGTQDGPELAALREATAGIAAAFGPLREWDVFAVQTLAPLLKQRPRHAGLRALAESVERLRGRHRAAAAYSLRSQDYQRLLLRLGKWLHGDYWDTFPADAPSLKDFARATLDRCGSRVKKRRAAVAAADSERLHELRIACKKLRYGAEMFASLFDAEKTKPYLAALENVQDVLGVLNDISVAHRLLEELSRRGADEPALTLVRAKLERSHARRLAGLGRAWKRFAARKTFW